MTLGTQDDPDTGPAAADGSGVEASLVPSDRSEAEPAASSAASLVRPGRRIDRGLLLACMAIAAGFVLIVWGLSTAVTGDEGVDRPEEIEALSPVEKAVQVLQQESIIVDLAPGFEGVLIIDGIEIEVDRPDRLDDELEPGEQRLTDPTRVRFDPGTNVLSFRPVEGAPIEELEAGRHSATVIFWRIEDGRGVDDQRYRWEFDVV